jgi:sugar lactone lactonase YvrE
MHLRFLLTMSLAWTILAQPRAPRSVYPRVDVAAGYQVDPSWPSEKAPGAEWGGMSSVAIAPDGNVWTFNRGKIPVQVFNPSGKLVSYWPPSDLFRNPHTLRFDHSGKLWVVDTQTHTVRQFTQDGKVVLTIGTPNEFGEDETHMNQPNDVAFGPNGEVFVSDGYGNNRIVAFDRKGKFLRSWGKLGSHTGEFSQPHSVAIDSKGRIYVADRNNSRIQIFDLQGKFLNQWENIITPWAIAITPQDDIYICGSSPTLWSQVPATQQTIATPPKDQIVMRLDVEGHLKQLLVVPKGENGKEKPGDLNWVHSMAVDTQGNLYFADVSGKRAQKFLKVPPAAH